MELSCVFIYFHPMHTPLSPSLSASLALLWPMIKYFSAGPVILRGMLGDEDKWCLKGQFHFKKQQ